LSFGDDLEEPEADEEQETAKKKVVKNPTVNTSFLPDRERELQEIEERKRLTEIWHQEQDLKKQEV
jgi:protein FAM50